MDTKSLKECFSEAYIDLEVNQNDNEYNITIYTNRYVANIVNHREKNSSVIPGIIFDESQLIGFDYKSINYDHTDANKIIMSYKYKDLLINLIVNTKEKEIFNNSGAFINVDYEKQFLVILFKQIIDNFE